MAKLIETIAELEGWAEDIGKTLQVTYRTKLRPRWLVRILWPQERRAGDELYAQAVADSLPEALENAVEAWFSGLEAEDSGRLGHRDED